MEPPKDLGEFDIKRLFEAVASGDVPKLAGLEAYLRRMAKRLSVCKNTHKINLKVYEK